MRVVGIASQQNPSWRKTVWAHAVKKKGKLRREKEGETIPKTYTLFGKVLIAMARLEIQGISQGFGEVDVLRDVTLDVESGEIACLLGPSGCGKTTLFHVISGLAQGISQGFGEVDVLRDVTLDVESGEIACLLGPSGCGKTTLFHVISGLASPRAGRVLLDGEDITGRPGHLSYMLQKVLLLQHKRIIDNVSLPLVLRGAPVEEARSRAAELFGVFGLEGTERRWPCCKKTCSCSISASSTTCRCLWCCAVCRLRRPVRAQPSSLGSSVWRAPSAAGQVSFRAACASAPLSYEVFVMRGNPQAGEPTSVVGSVRIGCPRSERKAYALTEGFLESKRRLLSLLG